MSLTSRIQALTAYANEVTAASDTTLADAVATLAEGYGQGGNTASGEFEVSAETKTGSINIGLSELNIFVLILEGIATISTSEWQTVLILSEFNEPFSQVLIKSATSFGRNNTGTFTYSNGVFSFSEVRYGLPVGTYKWYAC